MAEGTGRCVAHDYLTSGLPSISIIASHNDRLQDRGSSIGLQPQYLAVEVRFAPKATEVPRCREMTRWANNDILPCSKRPSLNRLADSNKKDPWHSGEKLGPRIGLLYPLTDGDHGRHRE